MYDQSNYETSYNRNAQTEVTTSSSLMRRVFIWMALALTITGVTAYGVATSPRLLETIIYNSSIFFGLIIAEFGLVLLLSACINRMSLLTATLAFIGYSVLNGATLSVIFLAYTMSSIATVFFIAAATFGVMAFYGAVTRTDLTSLGKLLFMALIGLIIATVVNFFIKSSMVELVCSYVGVLIFVGLTAYDTQKIWRMFAGSDASDDNVQKYAVIGALTLYLDFINLFLYLLRLFGRRR